MFYGEKYFRKRIYMEIAIVDDSVDEQKKLEEYLKRFAGDENSDFTIRLFTSGNDFLAKFQGQFDLILMDIDMPDINGIDTAKSLRKKDPNVVLMFVTNMPQYALAGYEVDAIDYVIKPVFYADFALKLKKAIRYVNQNIGKKNIVLHTPEGMVSLNISEILYVESELHYLIYHTLDASYRVRESMKVAEQKLAPYYFTRCNMSYLVNLKHVKAIIKDDVQVENQLLKISRGKKASFMEQFTRLLGGL